MFALLVRCAHEELHVRRHLLHGRNVHLARAQATRALLFLHPVAVFLAARLEVQLLGIFREHVADHIAVFAEEHAAIGVQHDALRLEGARAEPVVAVRDHVGVVQVDVVLSVEQRIDAHAIEKELAHLLFLRAERLAGVG